jgi:hypothetical protein
MRYLKWLLPVLTAAAFLALGTGAVSAGDIPACC